jgi:hypothetical protein
VDLSDDEKVVLGQFCDSILTADAFAFITNLYETSTVQQLLTTKPQDRGKRDDLYFRIQGVRDFLALMAQLVNEKDRLLDNSPKPSAEDDDKVFDIYNTDISDDDADV